MATNEPAEQRVAREDLVMFINACFSCSGQREFYTDASGQSVSIDFLHRYTLGNYRALYARTLAAGVNHFNQSQIIQNLLATGRQTAPADRAEENALVTRALARLPPQRVYRIFENLRNRRVNNRRTRAVIRNYALKTRNFEFDALKYRGRFRIAATHAHLPCPSELGDFLFGAWKKKKFETDTFETFRQAHFAKEAVYRLPYTIAEGLAARHRIPKDEFLSRISKNMTVQEKLRLQNASEKAEVDLGLDLARVPLTRLATYVTSLSPSVRAERAEELEHALSKSAAKTYRQAPYPLGRVAAVLDRSYSSSGSSEKRRRPLAVAIGAHYLLHCASSEFVAFWTPELGARSPHEATAFGQTDLAGPLLEALRWDPDLIVIISDGFENSPPGAAAQIVRAFRTRVVGRRDPSIVHLNPVFDTEHFAPRALGPGIPTVGIRNAEDLLTMLGFARFAEGRAPLRELEMYLANRVKAFLRERNKT